MPKFTPTSRVLVIIVLLLLVSGFLFAVFSGQLLLEQGFKFGPFNIRYYGMIMALAILAGYFLAVNRSEKYGINKKEAEQLIFWSVILGFVGARLYHVVSSWQYYVAHPIEIIKVWNGGLGIFGAMFGGVAVWFIFYFKNKNRPAASPSSPLDVARGPSPARGEGNWLLRTLDWGAPAFVLGQIIGRFGNLFNYEAFGYPTNLPWKMFVPEISRPLEFLQSAFYHPLFLYEALGNGVILFILLWLERVRLRGPSTSSGRPVYELFLQSGSLFFSYLFLYNTLRFFIEFLRTDSTFLGQIRLNSVTSGSLALVGLIGLMSIYYSQKTADV